MESSPSIDELRAENKLLKSVLDHMKDVVLTLNFSGVVSSVYGRVETMTGFAPTDLIGQHVRTLLPTDGSSVPIMLKILETAAIGDDQASQQMEIKRQDGSKLLVEVSVSVLTEGTRRMGIECVLRDLSDSGRTAVKLQESQNELQAKIDELERLNQLMVGREEKMIELKKQLDHLKKTD